MSRRNKLEKFTAILGFPNVYQNFDPQNPVLVGQNKEPLEWKTDWNKNHFSNDQPIILELACGKGDYCVALAQRYPNKNFIGIDIKGARIWKGAKLALENNLTNLAFFRTRIEQLDLFFKPNEISEIWITFPDPFPANNKVNRRLSADNFLEIYKKIIIPGGLIHLKTDAQSLYNYSLKSMTNSTFGQITLHNPDIYSAELPHKDLDIKTYYERKHLAAKKRITYIQFQMK